MSPVHITNWSMFIARSLIEFELKLYSAANNIVKSTLQITICKKYSGFMRLGCMRLETENFKCTNTLRIHLLS